MATPREVSGWCPLEGRPARSDDEIFEVLSAAVFQARFRPDVVQARWPALREAFDGFSLREVAGWADERALDLASRPGVIRNGKKLRAVIRNARDLESRARAAGSALEYLETFRPDPEALVRELDGWAHYVGAPSLRWFIRCAGILDRWGEGRAAPPHPP